MFIVFLGPKALRAAWSDGGHGESWLWLCQTRRKGKWSTRIFSKDQTAYALAGQAMPDVVAITPISRCGGTGPTAVLPIKTPLPSATAELR